MGLYNYLQGDKLLRDTLLLHKDIGPYERAVFSYLCLNTPDPQSPLPFVFRAANEYSPGSCHDIIPLPPRCYMGTATGLAEDMEGEGKRTRATQIRAALRTLVNVGVLHEVKVDGAKQFTLWKLVLSDKYAPDIDKAVAIWESASRMMFKPECADNYFNRMWHLHYHNMFFANPTGWPTDESEIQRLHSKYIYRDEKEASQMLTYKGWVKYLK